jgi:hypothetical protein
MASVENLAQLTAYRSDLMSKARQQAVAANMQVSRAEEPTKSADDAESDQSVAPVEDGKGRLLDMYA